MCVCRGRERHMIVCSQQYHAKIYFISRCDAKMQFSFVLVASFEIYCFLTNNPALSTKEERGGGVSLSDIVCPYIPCFIGSYR